MMPNIISIVIPRGPFVEGQLILLIEYQVSTNSVGLVHIWHHPVEVNSSQSVLELAVILLVLS